MDSGSKALPLSDDRTDLLTSGSCVVPAHRTNPDVSGRAEFLYLDQEAVLEAGVLDMQRAMSVVSEALILHETGRCRQPHKVVLRETDDARSEDLGRINGLFAL